MITCITLKFLQKGQGGNSITNDYMRSATLGALVFLFDLGHRPVMSCLCQASQLCEGPGVMQVLAKAGALSEQSTMKKNGSRIG